MDKECANLLSQRTSFSLELPERNNSTETFRLLAFRTIREVPYVFKTLSLHFVLFLTAVRKTLYKVLV
jgi:hypothetical protein